MQNDSMLLPKMLLGNVDRGLVVNPVGRAPYNDINAWSIGGSGVKEDPADGQELGAQLAGEVAS